MGHVFHLAWYMNGVGFGDSSRTSVSKIMASDPSVPNVYAKDDVSFGTKQKRMYLHCGTHNSEIKPPNHSPNFLLLFYKAGPHMFLCNHSSDQTTSTGVLWFRSC